MSAFKKGSLELRAVPGGLGGIISQLVIHNCAGEGGEYGVTDDPGKIPEPSRRMAGSRETVALPGLNCVMTVVLRIGEQTDLLRIRIIDGRQVERVKLPKPPRPDPEPDPLAAKKRPRKTRKPQGKKGRMHETS